MTRRFRLSLAALTLTLAAFALVPSEAKAAQVMCSNEYGSCEVQNSPSFITCSCVDESSTGGTGGNDYEGMTEEELMAVCEAELSWCQPQDTSSTGDTEGMTSTGDTFGTDTGDVTSTGDTEGMTSTGDTFGTDTGESTSGGEGDSTSGGDSGTSGDSGDSGTTSEGGNEGEGDAGTGTEGDAGGSEGDSGGGGSEETGTSAAEGAADEADADAGIDEGKGCSVANEPGYGVFALFGMLGLLGLRRRNA
jgi:MYXO-CTERM domain-containing protein